MKIHRAYRYELDPNGEQRVLLAKHAGVARFAYNWGLARWKEVYEKEKRSTTAIELHRELNRLKKTDFPWMYEVSKWAPQEALRDLEKAFKNFFRALKKGKKGGYPKFHLRIRNIRMDFLHKLTTELVRTHPVIAIEDLNVAGMLKNGHLARHIADVGWGTFRALLEAKAKLRGVRIVKAGRFAPTSKACSSCGHVLSKLPLFVREWTCPVCGAHHERDENAARNMLRFALAAG